MTSPYHIMTEAYTAAQTIGVLARMKTVVSMRLHGLIFAAGQGVPLVGIVYDQKVSSFLSYIGQDLYESLDSLSQERLIELIDGAVTRGKDPSFLSESVARLHRMEEVNHAILKPYVTEPKP
jgi:polysaccharide pyruvyl transferase WcaK-like protein